jgi:GntR family transcriptional regulator
MKLDKAARDNDGYGIEFRLDPASGVPPYLQLVHQVEHAIRLGYLVAGDQLPKVKDVVATLAINPNTVLKSYRELEYKGLAEGRPGQGTFVVGEVEVMPRRELRALRAGLARWLAQASAAGLEEEGIRALISDVMGEVGGRSEGRIA